MSKAKKMTVMVAILEGGAADDMSKISDIFASAMREHFGQACDITQLQMPTPITAEDSFRMWAGACISFSTFSRVRASEAFRHYKAWCARNSAPSLQYLMFGRRMCVFIAQIGGQIRNSNGRVYEGIGLNA